MRANAPLNHFLFAISMLIVPYLGSSVFLAYPTGPLNDFVLSFPNGDAVADISRSSALDANTPRPGPYFNFTPTQPEQPLSTSPAFVPQAPGIALDAREGPSSLKGKVALIAGVADASGFGWGIAKALSQQGATILIGSWVPMATRFADMLQSGKFDKEATYDDGLRDLNGKTMMKIAKIYPIDIGFDTPDDITEDVRKNKRFASVLQSGRSFTIADVAAEVAKDFGRIDILVHSIANGPEVSKPLLDTSRNGYLSASASSAYSLISMVQRFAPIMPEGGSVISLTYIASERAIPGYGGGMSSAKAALESDTKTLAYEAGRKHKIRVNTISAGPFKSRAASAIKAKGTDAKSFIDLAIQYSKANAPLQRDMQSSDVGNAAVFLASRMATAVTGTTLYVDNGLHAVGMASDSQSLVQK